MVMGAPPPCGVRLTLRILIATFAQSLEDASAATISGTETWVCELAAGALPPLELVAVDDPAVLVSDAILAAGTLLEVLDPDPPQPTRPAANTPNAATRRGCSCCLTWKPATPGDATQQHPACPET